jgi:hypothetical protein
MSPIAVRRALKNVAIEQTLRPFSGQAGRKAYEMARGREVDLNRTIDVYHLRC